MDRHVNLVLTTLEQQGPTLHALLLRLTLRHDAADDLMQELFLRLARSRPFAKAHDPAGYAGRVAINLAMDWRRGQRSRSQMFLPPDVPSLAPSPVAELLASEQTRLVLDAISKLRGIGREVLVLHYVREESYEAIAHRLGKATHQVRSIANKAMTKLRSRLGVADVSQPEQHSDEH